MAAGAPPVSSIGDSAENEFTQRYDVDRSITNLENAYWNVMARPVMEGYKNQITFINQHNVPFVS